MPQYCKAYRVEDLSKFPQWSEGNVDGLSDDDICFWDDFTAAKSCFDDSERIFSEVTEPWRQFCIETLGFEIPDDLKELVAQQQAEEAQTIDANQVEVVAQEPEKE